MQVSDKIFVMFKLLISLSFFSYFSIAQGYIRPEQKTQNNDLRSFKNLFEIRSLEDEGVGYKLNVINNDQYIVIYSATNENQRISAGESEKIDNKFVSEFIKMKYSMERISKGICFKSYELVMRGEKHTICKDEINKMKMIKEIITSLDSYKKEN